MRCSLLIPVCAVSVHPSVYLSVCLSVTRFQLHCAETAEWIKMVFEVNTLGGPRDTVLHGVLILPQTGGGGLTFKFWDPSHIS